MFQLTGSLQQGRVREIGWCWRSGPNSHDREGRGPIQIQASYPGARAVVEPRLAGGPPGTEKEISSVRRDVPELSPESVPENHPPKPMVSRDWNG
jgi:hypothetical protein